jgi:indolepyruvate ferredoxin oxidoreductase
MKMRRLERALSAHYEATVLNLAATLTPDTYARAVKAAEAATSICGYEDVKTANIQRYLAELDTLAVDTTPIKTLLIRKAPRSH